jgi:hypothetical protein
MFQPPNSRLNGMTVQANNADQFRWSMRQQRQQNQMDSNQYASRK